MPARLERLTLHNFKSFRNASIPFAPGFTAIMGPNGSGKSNIIDAIVFVLGEGRLKLIRASRLHDLVNIHARDGKAIVTVDFIGPDGQKYSISREINKKGQSVYRLNGKRTTRSHILSVLASLGLSPNGYNIVLQGEITKIIKMTPRERRTIIDEVAGVAEYEERKQEALKELESVEEKIKDAQIVLGERKAILEKLKAERDAALRYQELNRELKSLRKAVLLRRREELTHARERIVARLEDVNKELTDIDSSLTGLSSQQNDIESQLDAVNAEIREIYSKMGEGRVNALREELMRNQANMESLQQELTRVKDEIIKLTARKDKLLAEREAILAELSDVRIRKEEKEAKLADVNRRIDELTQQINAIESESKSKQAELLEIEQQLDELKKRFSELREEHAKITSEYNTRQEMSKKEQALLEKIQKAKDELSNIEKELHELERTRKEIFDLERSLNQQYLALQDQIKELREEVGSLRGAANVLRSLGVDTQILDQLKAAQKRGELFGIHDYVFRLVKYDKQHATAVETAAGRRLFYIVVDTADAAAEAIKYLKRHNLGSATFIPMDRVAARLTDVPRSPGVLGRALDFVRYDERYARAMAYVFGDTVVVDNVDNAKRLAGKYRAVTLDGDVVERSGIMSGGAKRRSFNLLSIISAQEKKKELEEAEAEAKQILARLYEIRDRVRSVSSRISELNARRTELKKFIESAPVSDSSVFEALQKRMAEIEREMESLANQISDLEMKKAQIAQSLKRGEGKDSLALFNQLSALRQEQDVLSREVSELALVVKEKEERLKYLDEQISDVSERLDSLARRRDELTLQLDSVRSEIDRLEQQLVEAEKQAGDVRDKLQKLHDRKDALETELREILSKIGELNKKKEILYRERVQLESKRDSIVANIAELDADLAEYQGIDPISPLPPDPNARISEILDELRSLEPINMRAIEEYEEAKERIDEVESRISKLEEEKRAILDMMNELERKKEKAFMDTFLAIRKRFKEVYKELEDGDADLRISNESDIFNSGLIIEARPKGRELQNIDAMSGGEKAMVAIAFILAIALTQPAAFYILDEPDQALDKRNVEKVARFVKRLSQTTQFIVVSHRDAFLKEADQIIGVYLKKDGSSAVEVKL
ncbi:MAG: chromosome segregation protein SMC [Candidatus Diapherotrites archaeon]|nr:chromosome segregation protein SMC [Candidatus Diapherotrites archaeon]